MYCSECGKKLSDQAKFCPECGHVVEKTDLPNQNFNRQKPVYTRENNATLELVFKGIIGVLMIVFLVVSIKNLLIPIMGIFNCIRYFYFPTLKGIVYWGMYLVNGILMLANCFLLFCLAIKRKNSNSFTLQLAFITGALVNMIWCMVTKIYYLIITWGYSYRNPNKLMAHMGIIFVCLLVVEILLLFMKEFPIDTLSLEAIKFYYGQIGPVMKNIIGKDEAEPIAKKEKNKPVSPPMYSGNTYSQNTYSEIKREEGTMPGTERMKTDRSLLMYILLSIVTCGIYSWYFIYSIARDMNVMCDGDGENTGGLLKFILLSLITCGIYSIVWEYKLGNRLQENAPRYGQNFSENGTTILLWHIFGAIICGIGPFIAMSILIKNVNRLADAYNRCRGL